MKCRNCAGQVVHNFLDLGYAPPSNAYLRFESLSAPEVYYPLKVVVCGHCWLVQTEDYTDADSLFTDQYAYFSSTSLSWLNHAASYVEMITSRVGLTSNSFVVEIASNDGYLLKNFVKRGIPCLGVEPTDSTASASEKIGVPVLREFFSHQVSRTILRTEGYADLIIGNNVYAHVPDINDFTKGLKTLLNEGGTITLEFPHLMRLVGNSQFDTIYHEHFSYLSLGVVNEIFKSNGLRVWDVDELPTHGGSLRVYGCHENDSRLAKPTVDALLDQEVREGVRNVETYLGLQARAERIKDELLTFLIDQRRSGKTVVGYGAAAKGNTLLNFAGVKEDLLSFICDASEFKQGQFTPGGHIPIISPEYLAQARPDYVLILPWNLADEVMDQNKSLKQYGTQFVTAIPKLKIYDV